MNKFNNKIHADIAKLILQSDYLADALFVPNFGLLFVLFALPR
jgi:hypothetical protein